MAIKLHFDVNGNVDNPTLILARRNGTIIGELSNISEVRLKGAMQHPEMFFKINKYDGDIITPYWDDILDFKLVWCKDIDTWFEMKINENHSDEVVKSVVLQRLGEAELGQTQIHNMEINTEADILRDDYVMPTLFYYPDKPEASLLHRLLDKNPNYTIEHVDEHLKGIQRVFSFNDKSVSECFDEIAEQLDVLFVYNSVSTANNKPKRTISVYDLKNYCKACGARGSFINECLNCGSTNVTHGYGEDTTICVSREDLGQEITITVNQDDVKNCFYLEAGDDLMTATVRNCNPNGTSYIWNPGTNVEDMDVELQELLDRYSNDYDYYRDKYVSSTSSLPVSNYNTLVNKYKDASEDISPTTIGSSLTGYSPIMQHYYDAVDLEVFLKSGLLPSIVLQDTTASIEAAKLTASALSPVAVVDAKYMTLSNASTAVLNAAKIAADPRYKIAVKKSSFSGSTWTGNFTVTNYSDERDTCDSAMISVTVNADYETYIDQKLKKTLYNGMKGKYGSITQMLDMSATDFQAQLKKYSLTALNSLNTCFTECLKLLSEQKIDKSDNELYSKVYQPVYNKISYIQAEVTTRENEVKVMQNMQAGLLTLKKVINDKLNLETYLGSLWLDFCSYRREGTFSNTNYISDYLTNKELFQRANEFMDLAQYEISKVSTYTHAIDSTLKNLLVIPEFKVLTDYFECGNWIRVKDDDGKIYKLRLMDYEIAFDNLENIEVTFSDATRKIDSLAPVKEILINSSNIINNYNAAMNKTNSSFESINDSMKDMITDIGGNNDYTYDSYYDIKDSLLATEGRITTDITVVDGLIRTEIVDRTNADATLQSSITQTANAIRSEVSKTYYTITDAGLLTTNLQSQITQTATDIELKVSGKVSSDDLIAELNSKLQISSNKIYMSTGQLIINSGNFQLDANGKITANAGQIGDFTLVNGALENASGTKIYYNSMQTNMFTCPTIVMPNNSAGYASLIIDGSYLDVVGTIRGTSNIYADTDGYGYVTFSNYSVVSKSNFTSLASTVNTLESCLAVPGYSNTYYDLSTIVSSIPDIVFKSHAYSSYAGGYYYGTTSTNGTGDNNAIPTIQYVRGLVGQICAPLSHTHSNYVTQADLTTAIGNVMAIINNYHVN